jgi:copper chaperone CopZ
VLFRSLGFFIAGLITVLVPEGFFEMYMGSDFISMLVMLAIGIPMYVCASASTPIAASLIMKGMSPGAALVFLLTGPATNAIGIAAITKVVGKKTTMIYLVVISVSALAFGYILNLLVNQMGLSNMIIHHHTDMLPMWLKLLGSVLLTLMLLWYYADVYLYKKYKNMNNTKGLIYMNKQITLNVSGMNCMHCQNSVKKAVESVQGTSNVIVDLSEKKVVFDISENSFVEKVKSAITFAGFTVENS